MTAGTLQITPRRTKLHRLFAYRFALLAGPGSLFIMIALLLPLLSIVVFSFWRTESYELYADWNLDNYRVMLTEPAYRVFFLRSFFMALAVTLGCLVIAWPVAYFIAKHGGRYRLLLVLLLAAPFFTGVILRIAALQGLFGPIGLINMTLTEVGLPPIQVLMYTPLAAGIGLVYLYVPFMITAIYLSVINFNFELLEVAKINGAKPWRAFIEITWPLNWIGTAIGLVVVFIPCLASAVTQQFGETGTWALGSAMGVALFVSSIVAIVLIGRSINLKRSGFTGVINP
jgi:ABC-type spermidine/putrescine transport system permease subunit I